MIETFPPMNGPLRPALDDFAREEWTADYSIATNLIYVAFPGGKAGIGDELSHRLAAKHGVGLYEASGGGEVWFPSSDGTLQIVHRGDGNVRAEDVVARLLDQLHGAGSTKKK